MIQKYFIIQCYLNSSRSGLLKGLKPSSASQRAATEPLTRLLWETSSQRAQETESHMEKERPAVADPSRARIAHHRYHIRSEFCEIRPGEDFY